MELGICKAKSLIYYNFSKDVTKHQQLESALCLGYRGELLQFKHPRWEPGYIRIPACKILLSPMLLFPRGRSTAAGKCHCTAITVLASVELGHFTAAADLPQRGNGGGEQPTLRMAIPFISLLTAGKHCSCALLGSSEGDLIWHATTATFLSGCCSLPLGRRGLSQTFDKCPLTTQGLEPGSHMAGVYVQNYRLKKHNNT